MNNFEYLIAGLPVLSQDWTAHSNLSAADLIEEIRKECSKKDNTLIDSMLSLFEEQNMNQEFYDAIAKHKNRFIREYAAFDLHIRNAKVRYLNERLGRESGMDCLNEPFNEFEEDERLKSVLYGNDLLEREKGLDSLMWEKISEMNLFDYFNIELLLGYICKLKIIDRWLSLDEKTGREMFRKLVDEIRGTFKGVEYKEN